MTNRRQTTWQSSTAGSGNGAAVTDGRPTGPPLVFGDFARAFKRFRKDRITDHAAGLTYYSLLSLFPALLFGVAALGYFGRQQLIGDAADYLLQAGAPKATVDSVTKALASAQWARGSFTQTAESNTQA